MNGNLAMRIKMEKMLREAQISITKLLKTSTEKENSARTRGFETPAAVVIPAFWLAARSGKRLESTFQSSMVLCQSLH